MKRLTQTVASAALLFVAWQVLAMWRPDLPAPLSVIIRGGQLFASRDTYQHIGATLWMALLGYAIACLSALGIAFASSLIPASRRVIVPALDFARSLPAAALIPPLLTFTTGTSARVGVVAIGCTAVLGLAAATRPSRHRDRDDVVRTLAVDRKSQTLLIDLPQSIAELALASRLAVSLALVLAVVIEMLLGAAHGLGDRLTIFAQNDRPAMYVVLILLGMLGLFLNRVLEVLASMVNSRYQ